MTTNLAFPLLKTSNYLAAIASAETNIRKRLNKPDFKAFQHEIVQPYPPIVFRGIVGLLVLVLLFSFWVSAGKQVASAGMIFDELPAKYQHLSTLWAGGSIIAMLLLSEAGAILFLVAAGTIAASAPMATFRGKQFSPIAWIFRAFALLCAGYAIVSNVTITILDPVSQAGALQWGISIGVPSIVLGLGVMLERMVIASLHARAVQTIKYHEAMRDYQQRWDEPSKSGDYWLLLKDALWTELNRTKDLRERLLPFADDPKLKHAVVVSEYQAHISQQSFTLEDTTEGFLASDLQAQ